MTDAPFLGPVGLYFVCMGKYSSEIIFVVNVEKLTYMTWY